MTESFGMHQLIHEATHYTSTSANILDLIFTDSPAYVTDVGTIPPIGTSKHAVIYCKCSRTRTRDKPYTKEIWKYQEADVDGINIAIEDFPFEDVLGDYEDVNQIAEIWTHLILSIAREYIPNHTVKINPQDKPWINKDIKHIIKVRDRLYRRYTRTGRQDHHELYNRVKGEVNKKITEAKQNHKQHLIKKLEDLKNSPKQFWSVAKQVYGNRVKNSIPTLIHNGRQHCTSEEKANLLTDYFAAQSQAPTLTPEHTWPELEENNYLSSMRVTEEEVLAILKKLQVDKSVGPDGISNKLLKMASRTLAPSMTMMFNKILSRGTFPQIWKQANVTPIHKKGSRQDVKNYRPISLLSCVGKILERLLFNKIYAMCEERELLTWRNSAYKKNDSTVNQLIHIVNNIYKILDTKEDCAMVFLDQSKAFDRICHEGLKRKLKLFGIQGPLHDLLCSYLDERSVRVVLDGSSSKWQKITAGVPQGSILGPLLFLIYINDIVLDLDSEIHLYADDAVISLNFNRNNTEEQFEQLNRDIQRLSKWAATWFMSFNPVKTKFMVISNSHQENYPVLTMNGTNLERVQTYPQLGLHFNQHMSWSNHIDEQISKAGKKIGLIWKLSCSIPRFAVENIYTAYIRPQIEYANVVYANCTKEQSTRLEALQRRAAIACTRAYNRTPTKRILDELGWPTLECRRNYSSLVQLYKIRHGLTPRYLHSILPQRQGTHGYPTRRVEDYILPITRTARYHKSFIPATCKKWNQLNEDIKCKPTVNSFKAALKKKYSVTKHKHYSYGKDKWAVAHTRMRLGLSPLKQHLHSYHIVPSPCCPHCDEPESTTHLLLKCNRYAASRSDLFRVIGPTVDKLGIGITNECQINNILLFGHTLLTLNENKHLFQHVQTYLKETKRF